MGQASPFGSGVFPLPGILRRVKGLAEVPITESEHPFLEDVMDDPIVRKLMEVNHLREGDVREAISRAQPYLLRH